MKDNNKFKTCPACHYMRKASDTSPDWMCPNCGIAYNKYIPKEVLLPPSALKAANKSWLAHQAEQKEKARKARLDYWLSLITLPLAPAIFISFAGHNHFLAYLFVGATLIFMLLAFLLYKFTQVNSVSLDNIIPPKVFYSIMVMLSVMMFYFIYWLLHQS